MFWDANRSAASTYIFEISWRRADELIDVIGAGQRHSVGGQVVDVLGLIADAFDLLEQQGVAQHETDVAAATYGNVNHEFGTQRLFGLVDAGVGRLDVGADRLWVRPAQHHGRRQVERMPGIAQHRDRLMGDVIEPCF